MFQHFTGFQRSDSSGLRNDEGSMPANLVNELRRFCSAGYNDLDSTARNYFHWNSTVLPRLRVVSYPRGVERPFGTVST